MSTQVLPALPGIGFPWSRKPKFSTRRQTSISGKEVRIADWSSPRYTWTLNYDFLRQGNLVGTWTEYTQLRGFFEQMLGGFGSFLYDDTDDDVVTAQQIGAGDGATVAFQLVRTSGGFAMPILAPKLSATYVVRVNGVVKVQGVDYTVSSWGASTPGVITFASAPAAAAVITADFSYYFPVRFDDDEMTFDKFMSNLYSLQKMSFTSIK